MDYTDDSDVKMRPRNMEFIELVSLLEKEHRDVKTVMSGLSELINREGVSDLKDRLMSLREVLLQHIVDEESSVLRILINRYGREGSRDALEVFREHVDILGLLNELEASVLSNRQTSAKVRDKLDALMSEHFRKEDDTIFPWAIKTHLSGSGEGA
ncbi:MAG: hypothetical protein KIS30_01665 [Thermoplasmata archaeon]|nr:hypothetical protein [Candidatus Sysuiplasma acidicola]MBX8645453.1 hypothetical protein [Candidatus Sysuiplasma acidicola]